MEMLMRKHRGTLSLSTQMVIVIFVGIVIPSIVFFAYFVTKYSNSLLRQAVDERQILLEEANKNIELQLEHYADSSMNLYYNNSLLEYINSEEYQQAPESVVDYLAMIVNSQKYVDGVALCMGDSVYTAGKIFLSLDSFRGEYEETVLGRMGRTIWLPTEVLSDSYGKEREDFTLARAVNSRSGQAGVFYLFCSSEIFDSIFTNDIFTESGSNYYILSGEGQIITGSRDELTGTHETFGFSDKLFATRTGHFTYTDETGGEYVVVCAEQGATGWISVTVTDCDVVYSSATAVKTAALMFAGLDVVMLIAAYLMLHSFLIVPLRRLEGGMRGVSQGNFTAVELPWGYSEIHVLTESYNYMVKRIGELIDEVRREEAEKNRERLKVLSMHVGPHFLNNTLNTIKWMAVLNNQNSIKQVVESLMKLMAAVTYGREDNIALEEEISLLSSYVHIQRVRFMNFQIVYDVPEELLTLRIGRFLLQPLVENSILHGFQGLDREGMITVTARRDEHLIVTVGDNGIGFDTDILSGPDKRGSRQDHVGLRSIQERIRLHYGPGYGLTVVSVPGEGTSITLTLPVITQEEEEK